MYEMSTDAFVLRSLTNTLPSRHIRSNKWHHINSLQLADPHFVQPNHIDVLTGADVYADIILSGLIKGNPGEPIAQNTVFGWILSGIVDQSSVPAVNINVASFHSHIEIESLIERFREIEEFPSEKSMSSEDQ